MKQLPLADPRAQSSSVSVSVPLPERFAPVWNGQLLSVTLRPEGGSVIGRASVQMHSMPWFSTTISNPSPSQGHSTTGSSPVQSSLVG